MKAEKGNSSHWSSRVSHRLLEPVGDMLFSMRQFTSRSDLLPDGLVKPARKHFFQFV